MVLSTTAPTPEPLNHPQRQPSLHRRHDRLQSRHGDALSTRQSDPGHRRSAPSALVTTLHCLRAKTCPPGTAGIGRTTVLNLAKHQPAHIYFTGRSAESAVSLVAEVRALDAAAAVQITFVQMDLASLAACKQAASALASSLARLDVVVCNAGIMAVPAGVSAEGHEIHMATNHLGHAMLLRHLLPVLEATAALPGADVRIVVLTSTAWRGHPGVGIAYPRLGGGYDGFIGRWQAYSYVQYFSRRATHTLHQGHDRKDADNRGFFFISQSKFANLLYAAELARRHPAILTVSLQPGVVATSLISTLGFWDRAMIAASTKLLHIPTLTPEQGCHNSLWAAAAGKRAEMVNGAFYMPVGQLASDLVAKDKLASDPGQAARLWEWTEEALDKI